MLSYGIIAAPYALSSPNCIFNQLINDIIFSNYLSAATSRTMPQAQPELKKVTYPPLLSILFAILGQLLI